MSINTLRTNLCRKSTVKVILPETVTLPAPFKGKSPIKKITLNLQVTMSIFCQWLPTLSKKIKLINFLQIISLSLRFLIKTHTKKKFLSSISIKKTRSKKLKDSLSIRKEKKDPEVKISLWGIYTTVKILKKKTIISIKEIDNITYLTVK